MLQDNSEIEASPFLKILNFWILVKKETPSLYKETLETSIKSLSKIYAEGKEEWFLSIVGQLIKSAFKELRIISLEEKKTKIPF